MYKILILAYLIGQDPALTMKTFQMERTFDTMQECKNELLLQKSDGRYEVMNEFVIDGDFKWDWLAAGCQNDAGTEEFVIEPSYPKGKPDELLGIDIIPGFRT